MAIKKRKKARGRPRIEGVAREPSGRISRSGRGFTRVVLMIMNQLIY
ncbi:hypothetical protein [Bartonella sp. DGB2]